MKATRLLSLVLAAIMLCSCFLVGCGKKTDGGQAGGALQPVDTNVDDESKVLDLEVVDMGGHIFRFMSRKTSHYHLDTHEIYAESITGDDKLNDAVYNRNAQLKETYNCDIQEEKTSSPASSARESLLAGDYVADFLFDEARLLRTLAADNLLADTAQLENIDLSKAWYDPNGLTGLNIGGKVFFIVGDGCILDDISSYLFRVNRDFIKEYDSSIDLYQEAREGKWTIDRLYELMVETAEDLDGNGILMPGEDRFGYNAERAVNWAHVAACGVTLSNVDDAGNYEIPLTPKKELQDAWDALKKVLTAPERLNDDGGLTNGLCTFYCCNTGSILNSTESTYDLGVLPMPKKDEKQEKYYTTVYFSQLCCFAIPLTNNNAEDVTVGGFASGVERAAYFLEVFSYYSMNILTPAFYNQVILKQSVRDIESAEMVEMCLENKIYDPVVGYSFGSINIFSAVGSANQNGIPGTDVNYDTLVSTYESRVAAARKALNNYLNYINTDI
ncbi:MAG: hypothetical protein IKC69_02990 [Clostridia bacterium]|nr:hypothetical protein [Clostridia bacterium]